MDQKPTTDIVFLTGGGPLYWIIANALVARFGPITIIREGGESSSLFFRRRKKRLGTSTAVGQLAFTYVSKAVSLFSRKGRNAQVTAAGASMAEPDGCTYYDVDSVNSPVCRQLLSQLAPKVVMVVGTRMILKQTLDCVDAPFINYHPGITPSYRGMNGVYWSRVRGDSDNVGITVHLVDENVDTGGVLYQKRLDLPKWQNITTYNHYCAVQARPLVVQAVDDALNEQLNVVQVDLPSMQWYPPTAWGYLWTGVARGVW